MRPSCQNLALVADAMSMSECAHGQQMRLQAKLMKIIDRKDTMIADLQRQLAEKKGANVSTFAKACGVHEAPGGSSASLPASWTS